MLNEVKETVTIDTIIDAAEEDLHWLCVAGCIVDANKGKPNPDDINPLIPLVEQRYGTDIWDLLLKIHTK